MIKIIKDSILDAKEKYIVHQCNAVTNQAGGLAYYIFKKFPYADIYKHRPFPYRATGDDFPGHCVIKGDGINERFVINLIGQYFPGKPANENSLLDSEKVREGYFYRCLNQISKMKNIESIAFPIFIGCGMAKGNWNNYLRMIKAFALDVRSRQNISVVIYDNEDA